jgi:hypothetical protein
MTKTLNQIIFFFLHQNQNIYFFLSRKAQFFFPVFNIRLYDKNSESDNFFFPPPKSEYFFQQHWESEYFFRKKPYPPLQLNGRSLTRKYFKIPMQSVHVTTKVVSSNPFHGEMCSVQLYVIMLVSTRSVFFPNTPVPPSIKLTAAI